MRVTWGRAGENNTVAGQPFHGTELPRKEIQGELPTCERPSHSSFPFVPGKDLLAGLVTSGDHQWRQAHVLCTGKKRGRDQDPAHHACGLPLWSSQVMLSAAWISPSPATKGQKTEGAGNLSRRLGIYGEDDLNNDNIWSSTMKSIPSMIYYGNLNKYSEISEAKD